MNRGAMLVAAVLSLVGCGAAATGGAGGGQGGGAAGGAGGGEPVVDAGPVDSGVVDAGTTDAGTPDAGIPLATRIAAAQTTANTQALCTAVAPFYWELGDVSGIITSGAQGTTYNANTPMGIASASKWLFGAYVVERFKADVSQIDFKAMTMRSGYTSFNSCVGTATVAACVAAGTNGVHTPADDDKFSYGGGHFEAYAAGALGLGAKTNATLAAEYATLLGSDLNIAFSDPQPAGGAYLRPSDYAHFLQKILAGTLAIRDHLGEGKVCTLPGASCPTAIYSPSPEAWHYSYGHWIEDEPGTGDGAFSSAGSFGFYPWIDATKTYYGILARRSTAGMGVESALCGRLIRKAFITGVAQ